MFVKEQDKPYLMKIHERHYAIVEVFVSVGIFVYLCLTYAVINYAFADSTTKVADDGLSTKTRPDSKKKSNKKKRD